MLGKEQQIEQINAPWIKCGQMVRTLSWLLVVSWVVIVALAVALTTVFPLKTVKTRYVEFESGGNNFVRILPAGQDIRANSALLSVTLRRYVVDRETVDKITEPHRYTVVHAMSNDSVWERFKTVYGNPQTGLYYRKGFKRSIVIVQDSDLGAGVHQVEFLTYDTQDGRPIRTNKAGKPVPGDWIATIAYEYDEQAVDYKDRLLNPTGLIVTQYSLARRKS